MPPVSSAPAQSDDAEDLGDGVARAEYHGIPGLFLTWDAVRRMQVRIEQDKAELSIALARSVISEKIASDEAEQLRKSAKSAEWRATYGPPLAFAGGLTFAGILAAVLAAVLRQPQQIGVLNGQ